MRVTWGELLVGQLEFYWDVHLRPRLEGLADEEYFWEPAEGCWTLRPDTDGRYVLDEGRAPSSPAPLTTIAWRLNHLAATCLANRASAFFGDGSVPGDASMFDPRHIPARLPADAAAAIAFLERAYQAWRRGIRALDEAALQAPLGPRGGPYADDPMAALILHINREVMHHGGEICLLRDLYRATGAGTRHSRLIPAGG